MKRFLSVLIASMFLASAAIAGEAMKDEKGKTEGKSEKAAKDAKGEKAAKGAKDTKDEKTADEKKPAK